MVKVQLEVAGRSQETTSPLAPPFLRVIELWIRWIQDLVAVLGRGRFEFRLECCESIGRLQVGFLCAFMQAFLGGIWDLEIVLRDELERLVGRHDLNSGFNDLLMDLDYRRASVDS